MQKLSPRLRLRILRRRAGLSTHELGDLLGCCGDAVRRWEALNPSWQNVPDVRLSVAIQRWSKERGDEITPGDWFPEAKA